MNHSACLSAASFPSQSAAVAVCKDANKMIDFIRANFFLPMERYIRS
jgi:hypothetical protein